MTSYQLKCLAQQVMACSRYEHLGVAKTLARAILTIDDPDHFIRNMATSSTADPWPDSKPRGTDHAKGSPCRDRTHDADL